MASFFFVCVVCWFGFGFWPCVLAENTAKGNGFSDTRPKQMEWNDYKFLCVCHGAYFRDIFLVVF